MATTNRENTTGTVGIHAQGDTAIGEVSPSRYYR
jgi:hypothetical protein